MPQKLTAILSDKQGCGVGVSGYSLQCTYSISKRKDVEQVSAFTTAQ